MKINIEKEIKIKVDKSLGYPMIFIESERKDNAFLDAVKQSFFNIYDENSAMNATYDIDKSNRSQKECVLIGKWIDAGYLCFPIYIWGFTGRPFNCGPYYNQSICASISHVSTCDVEMFNKYCDAVADELIGKDNNCIKLHQLLGLFGETGNASTMKVRIKREVEIEVDNSLGYPMIFIESGIKYKSLLDNVKRNLFEFHAKGLKTLRKIRNFPIQEHASLAEKECLLIADWIDKGYLCFPAHCHPSKLASYCGPRFNFQINSSICLAGVPFVHYQRFSNLCTALGKNLKEEDNMSAKLQQLLDSMPHVAKRPQDTDDANESFEVIMEESRPGIGSFQPKYPFIFLQLNNSEEIEQVQRGMSEFTDLLCDYAALWHNQFGYEADSLRDILRSSLNHGRILVNSRQITLAAEYESMVISCLSPELRRRVIDIRDLDTSLTETWNQVEHFKTLEVKVQLLVSPFGKYQLGKVWRNSWDSIEWMPVRNFTPVTIPKFKIGSKVFLNMDSLTDASLSIDTLLGWVAQKAPKYQSCRYTVQEIQQANNLIFYHLDGILYDTWVPENFLKA